MNNRSKIYMVPILLFALVVLGCATGKKEYDVGIQLSQAGKEKEAVAYLAQAIAKEPSNKEYLQALEELKERLVNKHINAGFKALEFETPLTISTINAARSSLANAKEIDATHDAVLSFENTLNKQEQVFLSEIKQLYTDAKQFVAAEEWLKAYFNLQQVQSRFPNYEDSLRYLTETTNKGTQALYDKAKVLVEKDDLQGAMGSLRKALSIRGDHQPSRELLQIVRERDNKGYFLEKAKEEVGAKRWDQAIRAYQKALTYEPEDQELKELIEQVREKAGAFYIQKSCRQMDEGWLFRAFETYKLALHYAGNVPGNGIKRLRRDLTARAKYLAEELKSKEHFGSAWFWYREIESIDPDFPRIFYLTREMEDKIVQRVRKSIAVFDFSSPSDFADAGIIIANNLIAFLFKTASGDIKILERENLKSILEEMKLGQIGVVSANSAKEMGRVYGIDVAIMGSVLLYKVDYTSSKGIQTVRYEVGTRIEDNIEYLNWKAKHPRPTTAELAEAPPAKIKVSQYAEKDYEISKHKKISFVQISFRIVDVITGENIQVKTIERKRVVEDEGSAGVPEAGVEFDPVEMPSDTEMLQKMTEDVVAELGREALRPLQNLEKTYFEAGKQHLRRRDPILASEDLVNAIFDEKMKIIQDSPLTKEVSAHLDNIFLKYKVSLEDY